MKFTRILGVAAALAAAVAVAQEPAAEPAAEPATVSAAPEAEGAEPPGRLNSTGSETHTPIGFSPRRAGSNFMSRLPASAAESNAG